MSINESIKKQEKQKIQYASDEICPICGKYTPDGGVCSSCLKAHDLYEPNVSYIKEKSTGLYGWICPKCGAVMSPFTSFCPNCTQQNWELTCTTNTNSTNVSTAEASSSLQPDISQYLGFSRKDKLGYE